MHAIINVYDNQTTVVNITLFFVILSELVIMHELQLTYTPSALQYKKLYSIDGG